MKIVIDARESGTTTGRYIDKLLENLQKIDTANDYVVLYKSHRYDSGLLTAPNFRAERCDIKEFTFAEQLSLSRQIKRLKPDLVHFGMVQQPILYRGKTVTTMHDLTTVRFRNPAKNPILFFIKQTIYRFINWYVPRKSALIITPTEFVKHDIMQFAHVSGDNIIVTYEAGDRISAPATEIQQLLGKRFITYVGRPLPHKNLRRLIDAFVLLKKDHPELCLAIVGKRDALTEQHQQYVHDNNIDDVVFTGFASEGELRWLYEHASAYVFPSLSEGFGLPPLEAMQHGAPIVSSNATCLPEVLGDSAIYFNPLDINDMSNAINQVLSDKKLRDELVHKGKEQAAKYSWKRMADQTLAVYLRVLNSDD